MWTTAFSFAQRPRTGPVRRGLVRVVDVPIGRARVALDDGERDVALDPKECYETLRDVVQLGGNQVRVECDVDVRGFAQQLHLCVREETLNAALSSGEFAAEEHVVLLAKAVWRDARVCPETKNQEAPHKTLPPPCPSWSPDYPMLPHQCRTLAWMQSHERTLPRTIRYAGNLRITNEWFVDTDGETFTKDPSWREASLAGGVCSDGTGSGKTATVLRLVTAPGDEATDRPQGHYESHGTLVVLPLNLVGQWQREVAKFFPDRPPRSVWLVQGRDLRNVTMTDLCSAELVVTTFSFLRTSRPYAELVDAALGGRPRTRAGLSAWARRADRTEPILEAVSWRRVVVDELHQVLESARDLASLHLLATRVLWGLTATPVLDTDHAQHLYLLLSREKSHHPNLLAALIAHGVRSHEHERGINGVDARLHLVRLTAEERLELRAIDAPTDEQVVRMCTFVDVGGNGDTAEAQFRNARAKEVATLRARLDAHERAVRILERASGEMDDEVEQLAVRASEGDELATAQLEVARSVNDAHALDLAAARRLRDAARAKLDRREHAARFVRERVRAPACGHETAHAIAACGHVVCAQCARRDACPACGVPLSGQVLTEVSGSGGIGSKMRQLGELLVSLADESAVLFVQWKTMMRGTRNVLRAMGVRVLLLDGNAAHRTATLAEFDTGDAVLLLCLEDGFAGLHLPRARHVVFAHAIVGDVDRVRRLEQQAIARCVRPGQTDTVCVYSFVVEDTGEETMWRRTRCP